METQVCGCVHALYVSGRTRSHFPLKLHLWIRVCVSPGLCTFLANFSFTSIKPSHVLLCGGTCSHEGHRKKVEDTHFQEAHRWVRGEGHLPFFPHPKFSCSLAPYFFSCVSSVYGFQMALQLYSCWSQAGNPTNRGWSKQLNTSDIHREQMDSDLVSKRTPHSGSLGTHWAVPGARKLRLKGRWLGIRSGVFLQERRWGTDLVLSGCSFCSLGKFTVCHFLRVGCKNLALGLFF